MKKMKTKKGIKATPKKQETKTTTKPQKENRTKSEETKIDKKHELFLNVAKTAELDAFIDWISRPSVLREPETQELFAKKWKISEDILTKWKKRNGFYDEVMRRRRQYFKDDSADVILSLKHKCLKEGSGADVKVFLNYTGDLQDKTEHVVDEELQKALKKIGDVLPD